MYLGVDLGTSGIKLILTAESGEMLASQNAPLEVARPHPLWSEQNPQDWWNGFEAALGELAKSHALSEVKAIGLSGQMHGATLLDAQNQVIRPAILWNDGRCQAQCQQLEQLVADSRKVTGNIMMPGFTAPKLLWLKQHEPEHFARIHKVLLPKDYLRFLLTGEYASDMSDAAGTMWLDVQNRCWHEGLVTSVSGLTLEQMPATV